MAKSLVKKRVPKQNDLTKSSQEDLSHTAQSDESSTTFNQLSAYWLLGEWGKLSRLSLDFLVEHPQRASLAVMVASSKQHMKDEEQAREWLGRALNWGCSKEEAASVLASDVHNTLACLQALKGDLKAAHVHFKSAMECAGSQQDVDLAARSRAVRELSRLGLLDEAVEITGEALNCVSFNQRTSLKAIQGMQNDIRAAQNRSRIPTQEIDVDEDKLWQIAEECFDQNDVPEAIDQKLLMQGWTHEERYYLFTCIAELMYHHQDRLQAVNWVNQARLLLTANVVANVFEKYRNLAALATRFDQPDLAIDLSVEAHVLDNGFDGSQKENVEKTYHKMRGTSEKKQQHGQDLLIDYLKATLSESKKDSKEQQVSEKPILIEVGTTRENVPGQGSTLQLASLSKSLGINFITVDMDPHNSRWAQFNLELLGMPGKAVTEKGEVFLQQFSGSIDYVFLDAYDFDHGKHSELRQTRYQKYLGNSIDEQQCHLMHLECAKALVEKLSPHGVICLDDTWQDEQQQWTAKGTLAMPYLLENDFEIVDARNRAVLLQRQT